MRRVKVLIIPADVNLPVRQEFIDVFPVEDILCELILGEGITGEPVGYAGFGRTMLAFDEIAGDRVNADTNANPRANELWDYLAAQRGSALGGSDQETLLGTFVALGRGDGSVTDDESFTDVSDDVAYYQFKAGA